ncbi:MAG: hypothetical protein H7061_00875 [Bdellovibrionaceae bacterium]|nr:hypothetical protein [Bdellovibrio sp.]
MIKVEIGRTYLEEEFYQKLLFAMEENIGNCFKIFTSYFFENTKDNKIKIIDIVDYKNFREMQNDSRKNVEKKQWFELYENGGQLHLFLCRLDRTGKYTVVTEDNTRTQNSYLHWVDEFPPQKPMTQEEIREAVSELSGFFHDQVATPKLGSKKAM